MQVLLTKTHLNIYNKNNTFLFCLSSLLCRLSKQKGVCYGIGCSAAFKPEEALTAYKIFLFTVLLKNEIKFKKNLYTCF